MDDWGCGWSTTNCGTSARSRLPLADWSGLEGYQPPSPRNPFYYERLGPLIGAAGGRYVVLTAHNLLFSRLHKLRGFAATMEDFYLAPERIERVLDMIVDFKIQQCDELRRRFGASIDGLFVADDWGTQDGTFISRRLFDEFFTPRYRKIFDAIHQCGWHVILHSCGRINPFVPGFLELGVDVLNMQQSRSYGLEEFGRQFRPVCFAAVTSDDDAAGIERRSAEARLLLEHWGAERLIASGNWQAIGVAECLA